MKTKIKTLCRVMIPVALFSIALVVTSCRQDEFAGEENITLKSAVIPELTLAYPSIVIPGQDFEINYLSTCGKVMIERGYINGDPIMEGDVIIGYEKVYNGLACDTEFLQWESIGNNGFLPFSGGKITENWSRPGTYVYRAKMNHKAVHKSGCPDCTTFKGNQFECFTIQCFPNLGITLFRGTFKDMRDEKIYSWIKIGNQYWMAENLAWLPFENPASAGSATVPYYYKYRYGGDMLGSESGIDMSGTYGVLYNWPAALAACPDGWHLPGDSEWKLLEMTLGMSPFSINIIGERGTNQGTQMKTTSRWSNNGNGTNSSGFSGLPGGARFNGYIDSVGDKGYWWSSTEYTSTSAWGRLLDCYNSGVTRYSLPRDYGFSVRCVKN